MDENWSIYIDINGFSALWGDKVRVVHSLGELMRAIYRVGVFCYPESPDRLFAYQLGDSFLVASEFREESLDRCATVAVALMRHVAASGCFARAAIAEGDVADIQGCYPREVMDHCDGDHTIRLQGGIMVITPVMGSSLIAAVGVDKGAPKGPLVSVEASKCPRLKPHISSAPMAGGQLASIDWVHMDSALLTWLQETANLDSPTSAELERLLSTYCAANDLPQEWRESVRDLLGVALGADPGTN